MSPLVRTCSTARLNMSRLIARALIVIGGLIWSFMFFGQATTQRYADLTYTFNDVMSAGVPALIPLALTAAVFVLALYSEQLAAAVLFAVTAGVVVWGLIAGWNIALWVSILAVLAMPMALSAALLLLAASTQKVCELEGVE